MSKTTKQYTSKDKKIKQKVIVEKHATGVAKSLVRPKPNSNGNN